MVVNSKEAGGLFRRKSKHKLITEKWSLKIKRLLETASVLDFSGVLSLYLISGVACCLLCYRYQCATGHWRSSGVQNQPLGSGKTQKLIMVVRSAMSLRDTLLCKVLLKPLLQPCVLPIAVCQTYATQQLPYNIFQCTEKFQTIVRN